MSNAKATQRVTVMSERQRRESAEATQRENDRKDAEAAAKRAAGMVSTADGWLTREAYEARQKALSDELAGLLDGLDL